MRGVVSLVLLVLFVGTARADDGPPAAELADAYRRAAAAAAESVVRVEPSRREAASRGRQRNPRGEAEPHDPLSGVIVDASGLILTSNSGLGTDHAVAPAAAALGGPLGAASPASFAKPVVAKVVLPDGRRLDARLLGRDHQRDLALLAVDGPLASPRWKDGSKLRVGQLVVAVGRGAPGLQHVLNGGIISAAGRFEGKAVQTDAKVNRSNLGGALATLDGRVVGVIVELSGRPGLNSGVAFAIPSWELRKSITVLIAGRDIDPPPPPFLGVRTGQDGQPGIPVTAVIPGTAAEEAGIVVGDRILAIEGRPLANAADLRRALSSAKVGDEVTVRIRRSDTEKDLTVKLKARPSSMSAVAPEKPEDPTPEAPAPEKPEEPAPDDGREDDGEGGGGEPGGRIGLFGATFACADEPCDEPEEDDAPAEPARAPSELTPGALGELSPPERVVALTAIAHLGSPCWAQRRVATELLRAFGARALDVLLDGAADDALEVRLRCAALLRRIVAARAEARRGYLGVSYLDEPSPPRPWRWGARIHGLRAGYPAGRAGVQRDDVIVEVDGRVLRHEADFHAAIQLTPPGTEVTLTVLRARRPITIAVRLAPHPDMPDPDPVVMARQWRAWCRAVGRPEVAARRAPPDTADASQEAKSPR